MHTLIIIIIYSIIKNNICLYNYYYFQVAQSSEATTSAGQHYGDSNSPGQSPGSPLQLSPTLDESQIARLATSAKELVQSLPQYQPKAQTAKRKTNKELEVF